MLAVDAVLGVERLRLGDLEGARGRNRIVRRLQDAPARSNLLLRLDQAGLQVADAGGAGFKQGLGADAHDFVSPYRPSESSTSNIWLAICITLPAA